MHTPTQPHIRVEQLEMRYDDFLIQRDLNFTINRGDVFVVMGGSGCGKSTLMKHMIGLHRPAAGKVLYNGTSFWDADDAEQQAIMRKIGVLYQQGALWSSLTLEENIAVPLEEYTDHSPATIKELASFKLSLVGLAGFEDYYPSEISGGMRKRAGLARAMALDPEILFFDEPSAGLDPISAKLLDDLILELHHSLNTTIVIVTHDLASIFAIGTNSVFLDTETKTMIAHGDPKFLRDHATHAGVRSFLTRGEHTERTSATPRSRRSS